MSLIRTQGKAYDSADVIISMLGNVANEVSEFSYDEKTKQQVNHYLGSRKAKSWSMGTTDFTASITMSMREQTAIENSIATGDKRLVNIPPFYITARYLDAYNKIIVDKVLVKFEGQGRKMNIANMGEGMQHTLLCLEIDWNVG